MNKNNSIKIKLRLNVRVLKTDSDECDDDDSSNNEDNEQVKPFKNSGRQKKKIRSNLRKTCKSNLLYFRLCYSVGHVLVLFVINNFLKFYIVVFL